MKNNMNDMLRAYRSNNINCGFKYYNILYDVVMGNRSPRDIRDVAIKIGMIIPPNLRHGLQSYQYLIDNLSDYIQVIYFNDAGTLALNNLNLFSDNVLVKSAGIPLGAWKSRIELESLVKKFLLKHQLVPMNWDNLLFKYEPTNTIYTKDDIINNYNSELRLVNIGSGIYVDLPVELKNLY